jgi:hypothetical protein
MDDDLVRHENNIIKFGDDERITGNGFQGGLNGLVFGLVGWLPSGFCFTE